MFYIKVRNSLSLFITPSFMHILKYLVSEKLSKCILTNHETVKHEE